MKQLDGSVPEPSSVTLFSTVVHAAVIAAALIAQVPAVGTLPSPHQPLMFDASHVMLVDIQRPAPGEEGV